MTTLQKQANKKVHLDDQKDRSLFLYYVTYIDMITFWTETNRDIFDKQDLKILNSYGCKVRYIKKAMHIKFKANFRQSITLHQPNRQALEYIIPKLAGCNIKINRVELAIDWIAKNPNNIQTLHKRIIKNLVYCAGSEYIYENHSKKTCYFASRSNKKDSPNQADSSAQKNSKRKSHSLIPVLYSDRESKIAHQPCTHLELRFVRSSICKNNGFRSLRDLLDVDIAETIKSKIRFCYKPSAAEAALLLSNKTKAEAKKMSLTSCQNKVRRVFKKDYRTVVAQEVFHKIPKVRKRYKAKHKAMTKHMFEVFFSKDNANASGNRR